MDLDGLEKLMIANHTAVMGKLGSLESTYNAHIASCAKRMSSIEEDVQEHEGVIQKSKGVAMVIGAIWAVISAIAALIAPYFWR